MSWDIFLLDLPDVKTLDDIPENFTPKPIGKHEDVIRQIQEAVPEADFSDKAAGKVRGEGYTVDIFIGDEQEIGSIGLIVHGGDDAIPIVNAIVKKLNVRGIDTGTGGFYDPEKALEGYSNWAQYRDQILGSEEERTHE